MMVPQHKSKLTSLRALNLKMSLMLLVGFGTMVHQHLTSQHEQPYMHRHCWVYCAQHAIFMRTGRLYFHTLCSPKCSRHEPHRRRGTTPRVLCLSVSTFSMNYSGPCRRTLCRWNDQAGYFGSYERFARRDTRSLLLDRLVPIPRAHNILTHCWSTVHRHPFIYPPWLLRAVDQKWIGFTGVEYRHLHIPA